MDHPCLRYVGMKQTTPRPHTPATVQIVTLDIAGMSCEGCARQVVTALNALEGVVHASVDLQKNRALVEHLDGLSVYPTTMGESALREAMAAWFRRRFALSGLDAATEVLPVNGSREALFAFAQTVVDASRPSPLVVCPNPFYQIYEGAALLAGARSIFLNQTAANRFGLDLEALSADEWSRGSSSSSSSPPPRPRCARTTRA